jgi:hypothetical protein
MNIWPFDQLMESRQLVDVRRDGLGVSDIRGFVVAACPRHVLLEVVSDEVQRNGYVVLRAEDIRFLRWGRSQLQAWARALGPEQGNEHTELRRAFATCAQKGWAGIVSHFAETPMLLTFHRELLDPSTCYVGHEVQVRGGMVWAEEVSVEGTIDGHFGIALDDVTRMDFGGLYEKALQRMIASSS